MTARHIALLASVACAATGCQDPYHERSAAVPTAPRRTAAPSSSTDTATAFAKRWINWNWNTQASCFVTAPLVQLRIRAGPAAAERGLEHRG